MSAGAEAPVDPHRAPPRVSVVLCTYDRVDLLPRAIRSVLSQTVNELELIVVDDASTDGTAEFLATVEDPRVRSVRMDENRGQAAARNVGLGLSRAPFVAFQDSDDEWLPEKLEIQLPLLESSDASTCLVYCDMQRVADDGSVSPAPAPEVRRGRLVSRELDFYQVYGLGIQSVVARRSSLESVGGFDERFRCFDDLELFVRLSKRFDFLHVRRPLVRYHHTEGVSSDRAAELAARARLLRRHLWELGRQRPWFLVREAVRVTRGRIGMWARRWGVVDRLASTMRGTPEGSAPARRRFE